MNSGCGCFILVLFIMVGLGLGAPAGLILFMLVPAIILWNLGRRA